MRKKRTFVGLFVILALLCLGIGYAAITKTLTINGDVGTGSAEDLEDNFVVYFSDVQIDKTGAADAVVTASVDPDAKAIETTLSASNINSVGEKVVITYTVKNDSVDLYAFLNGIRVGVDGAAPVSATSGTPIKVGENGRGIGYFNITINWTQSAQINPVGGTTTVVVTIEMTATPVEDVNYSFTIYLDNSASTIGYTS